MARRPQPFRTQGNRRSERSGWFVPATLGTLALMTLLLIAFAFGILIGVIRF